MEGGGAPRGVVVGVGGLLARHQLRVHDTPHVPLDRTFHKMDLSSQFWKFSSRNKKLHYCLTSLKFFLPELTWNSFLMWKVEWIQQ